MYNIVPSQRKQTYSFILLIAVLASCTSTIYPSAHRSKIRNILGPGLHDMLKQSLAIYTGTTPDISMFDTIKKNTVVQWSNINGKIYGYKAPTANSVGFAWATVEQEKKRPEKLKILKETPQKYINPGEDKALNLPNISKSNAFFGIFDGHASALLSSLISGNTLNYFASSRDYYPFSSPSATNIIFAKLAPVQNLSTYIRFAAQETNDSIISKIKHGFQRFHEAYIQFAQSAQPYTIEYGIDYGGTTALTAFIHNNKLILAWAGDSRAIVLRKKADDTLSVAAHTIDHDLSNIKEIQRLETIENSLNKKLITRNKDGEPVRVEGLNITRSFEYDTNRPVVHTQYIPSAPEIMIIDLCKQIQYAVLASDGVWHVLTNEDVKNIVTQTEKNALASDTPATRARIIAEAIKAKARKAIFSDETIQKYGRAPEDDITVTVIAFTYPTNFTTCPEKIQIYHKDTINDDSRASSSSASSSYSGATSSSFEQE